MNVMEYIKEIERWKLVRTLLRDCRIDQPDFTKEHDRLMDLLEDILDYLRDKKRALEKIDDEGR